MADPGAPLGDPAIGGDDPLEPVFLRGKSQPVSVTVSTTTPLTADGALIGKTPPWIAVWTIMFSWL